MLELCYSLNGRQGPSCSASVLCVVMLAGAQIPLEDVPSVQKEIVVRCRQAGKPVIVASHLLQSMIEYPTPTRAEVCTMLQLSIALSRCTCC